MTTAPISKSVLLSSIEADLDQWVRVAGVMEGEPLVSQYEPNAAWRAVFGQVLRTSTSNALDIEHADTLLNTFGCFTAVRSLSLGLSSLIKNPNATLIGLLVMADKFDLKTYSIFGGYVEKFLGASHSFRLHASLGNTKVPVMLLMIKDK